MTQDFRDLVGRELAQAVLSFTDLSQSESCASGLLELSKLCSDALNSGGTIFFAGNGGSFADAQHMAAEFSGKLSRPRKPLASIALGTNSSSMSAIGNDFGFEHAFARELEAFFRPGSIVVAFSTSGNSANLVELASKARELDVEFWAMTGSDAGLLSNENTIRVPSSRTERIQELQTTLGHILCLLIEERLGIFGD